MFDQPAFPRKLQQPAARAKGVSAEAPNKDAAEAKKAIGVLASIQIDFLKEQIRNMADQIKELELLAPLETDPVAAGIAYREQFPRPTIHEEYPAEEPSLELYQNVLPATYPVAQQVVEISSGPLDDAMHILSSLPPEVVGRLAELLGGGIDLGSPHKPLTPRSIVVASRQVPPMGWRY